MLDNCLLINVNFIICVFFQNVLLEDFQTLFYLFSFRFVCTIWMYCKYLEYLKSIPKTLDGALMLL